MTDSLSYYREGDRVHDPGISQATLSEQRHEEAEYNWRMRRAAGAVDAAGAAAQAAALISSGLSGSTTRGAVSANKSRSDGSRDPSDGQNKLT